MKQYEIWWAELPKPSGRRRVLLLSRDDAYSVLNKFVAAEITATISGSGWREISSARIWSGVVTRTRGAGTAARA